MIHLKDLGTFESVPELVTAIINKNITALESALKNGWDIDEPIQIGKYSEYSPLQLALVMDCLPSVKWLVEHGVDLNDKENSFNFLKKDLNSVSIPEGYLNYYNNLIDIFSLYSSYLNSMRTAIIYERSSSDYKKNKTVIDKNYDNAYKKYNNVLESIQQFLSLLENS